MPTVPRALARAPPPIDEVYLHMAAHVQHQYLLAERERADVDDISIAHMIETGKLDQGRTVTTGPKPKGGFTKEDIEERRDRSEHPGSGKDSIDYLNERFLDDQGRFGVRTERR
jgi:hypothetical protein